MYCVLAGVADYVFMWWAIKYIKQKRYREIWSAKTKMISFSMNIALTIFCSLMLYDQYLSPECKVVTEQFNQCMLMHGDDFDMGNMSVAISRNMKESLIQMSDNLFWCIDMVTSLNGEGMSDEEKIAKTAELKTAIEQKKAEMVVHQQELKRTEIFIASFLFLNFIRLLLWGWTDLVASFKRLRARLAKRRATV